MARPKTKKVSTKLSKVIVFIYDIILELNGQEYKSNGNTFEEAIEKIKPLKYTTRGVLNVFKGGKKARTMLNIMQMKKIFGTFGGVTQKVFTGFFNKRIEQLLK